MIPINFCFRSRLRDVAFEAQIFFAGAIRQSLSGDVLLQVHVVTDSDASWWTVDVQVNECLEAILCGERATSEGCVVIGIDVLDGYRSIFFGETDARENGGAHHVALHHNLRRVVPHEYRAVLEALALALQSNRLSYVRLFRVRLVLVRLLDGTRRRWTFFRIVILSKVVSVVVDSIRFILQIIVVVLFDGTRESCEDKKKRSSVNSKLSQAFRLET